MIAADDEEEEATVSRGGQPTRAKRTQTGSPSREWSKVKRQRSTSVAPRVLPTRQLCRAFLRDSGVLACAASHERVADVWGRFEEELRARGVDGADVEGFADLFEEFVLRQYGSATGCHRHCCMSGVAFRLLQAVTGWALTCGQQQQQQCQL